MDSLTWLSIAGIVAIAYGPMQNALESVARHHLFRIRDELFDKARTGETSFDSPEYLIARKRINSLIRFTHQMKWQNVLFISKFVNVKKPDDADNSLYMEFRQRIFFAIIGLIILRSPLLMALTILLGIFSFIGNNTAKIKSKATKILNAVEAESQIA